MMLMKRGCYSSSINLNHLWSSFPIKPTIITSCSTSHSYFLKRISIMSSRDQEMPRFEKPRVVVKSIHAMLLRDGDKMTVRKSIGSPELKHFDPFLMLDIFSVTSPAGFPDHPHRGFETVTYMLEGAFIHQDFAGNKGTIREGDLQWMTAGRGIIHSEMPAGNGMQTGLQLWINLSSKDKMIEPRYQDVQSKDVAQAEKDGVAIKIIAGEAFGVRSPVYTRTPTMFLDVTMNPGAQLQQPVPESWNAFVYVIEGEGTFGGPTAPPSSSHHALALSLGDGVGAWNRSEKPVRFLLVGGQPLNEPVVQRGPFVMNTQAEIEQAVEDYGLCKNGFEKARQWRSQP